MQPHEVNMDLVLEAEQASRRNCQGVVGGMCHCPTDDQIRAIIAAVYNSIYGLGYTDGFVDKGDLEG